MPMNNLIYIKPASIVAITEEQHFTLLVKMNLNMMGISMFDGVIDQLAAYPVHDYFYIFLVPFILDIILKFQGNGTGTADFIGKILNCACKSEVIEHMRAKVVCNILDAFNGLIDHHIRILNNEFPAFIN